MPARLLVDDTRAYIASAQRAAAFARTHPISFVLGGHIEMNENGELFPWQSQFHPHEHVLQMTRDDLLALPAALESFNGFYAQKDKFVMMNSIHILEALGLLIAAVLTVLAWLLVRYLRRRVRARQAQTVSI